MKHERRVRDRATTTVTPDFPQEAILANAQGIVYAIVLFNNEGKLAEVEILEAPHPSIAEAAVAALKQWEVRKVRIGGQAAELYGEVRFRFTITDGVGRVDNLPRDQQKFHSNQYIKRRKEINTNQRKAPSS